MIDMSVPLIRRKRRIRRAEFLPQLSLSSALKNGDVNEGY